MKYMLLIYSNENDWTEQEYQACLEDSTRLCHELDDKGQFLGASPLHSVSMATSIREREGKRMITDGPFAETREQLGGYFLIDVANLDEAMVIAERVPGVKKGTVEIRPLLEREGLPRKADSER